MTTTRLLDCRQNTTCCFIMLFFHSCSIGCVWCAPLFPSARGGPGNKGEDQGRFFTTSTMEREQPGVAAHRMQIESTSTPPAKDSTCERGSGQGRVGSKASGACRVPQLPAARPGAGSQVRAGPKSKSRRTLRSASPDARDRVRPQPCSIYRAPPHCGGRPSEQPTEPGLEIG